MGDIRYPQLHQIASPKLGINRQIEQGKVTNLMAELKPNPIAQMSFSLSGAFWPISFPLFQGSWG